MKLTVTDQREYQNKQTGINQGLILRYYKAADQYGSKPEAWILLSEVVFIC